MQPGNHDPHQRGAALITVLMLMTLSVILANMAVSRAWLNERIAGNYRAGVLAQMAVEAGISDAWGLLDGGYARLPLPASRSYLNALHAEASLVRCDTVDWRALPTYAHGDAPATGFRRDVCRDDLDGDGLDERYFVVTGFVGPSYDTRVAERRMRLRVETAHAYFATTNFIGGIAWNASIQWPRSSQSAIAGGTYGEREIPAMYLEYDPSGATFDRKALWNSIGLVNNPFIIGEIQVQPSTRDSLALIRRIYDACYAPELRNRCDYVTIVPPGASKKESRAETTEGLYFNLDGILDVRGNDVISGMAIVANVTIDPETGAWTRAPNHTVSLRGGGNAGSVRFDAEAVDAALAGMQAQGLALSLSDLFPVWGSQAGLVVRGWGQPY